MDGGQKKAALNALKVENKENKEACPIGVGRLSIMLFF